MCNQNSDIRTLPLVAKHFTPRSMMNYGQILKFNEPAVELTDEEHPNYKLQIIEIEPRPKILHELTCYFNTLRIYIPLEPVTYFIVLGPVIDKYRTRPFPGTNEIEAFCFEESEGVLLNAGVWHELPFPDKISKWLEITKLPGNDAKIAEVETRNYEEILKVNFRIESPNTDDFPKLL